MWLSWLLVADVEARRARWEPSASVSERYNEGVTRLEAGDLVSAQGLFAAVLDDDPRCGMCQHALALTQVRMNRPAEGISTLVAALEDHGQRWEIQGGLAQAYFAAQDFDRARTHAAAAVALAPAEVDVQRTYQLVLLRLGAIDDAARALEVAAPDLPGADRACLAVRLWSEADDAARAADWLQACTASVRPDLVADARSAYATATGDHEALARAAADLGLGSMSGIVRASALMEAGEAAEAAALCDTILAATPEAADARAIRAGARWDLGDREGAKQDLETLHASGTWIDVATTGAMSGIVTHAGQEKLELSQARARGLLALIYLDELRVDDAAVVLAGVDERYLVEDSVGRAALRLLEARVDLEGAVQLLVELDRPVFAGEFVAEHPAWRDDPRLAPLLDSDDVMVRFNNVVALANGEVFEACAEQAEALAPTLTGTELEERHGDLLRMGYGCAARGRLLDTAGRLLASMDAAGHRVEASALYNHTVALLEAGDLTQGAAVLARIDTDDADLQVAVDGVALWLAVEHDDLDTALTHARSPQADPVTLLALAGKLARADRRAEAGPLLDRACPSLAGDALQACEELRDWLDADG